MTKLEGLEKRVDSLEPRPANTRSALLRGLVTLSEDDQVCLAYLIRDLEKENVNPDDFEAWLSKRPENQQALARKVLAPLKERLDAGAAELMRDSDLAKAQGLTEEAKGDVASHGD